MWSTIKRILNTRITQRDDPHPDVMTHEKVLQALKNPFVREKMIEFSRDEFERNPYYANVINTLANHVITPTPGIIALGRQDTHNVAVEDAHRQWSACNGIGASYRNLRKEAALTGLGLMLPFKKENYGIYPIKLGYKVYGADSLLTPWNALPEDRIIDGIEYDKEWNIVAFHFKVDDIENRQFKLYHETRRYTIHEVYYWSRGYETGRLNPVPECVQGFTIYPFIRRFMEASIKGEEFRTSFPMAVELDPQYYKIDSNKPHPRGVLPYEPNMIPTLPPGSSLKGIPGSGSSSADKASMLKTMASACALCVQMPGNLATGDSSNMNMATAQVDIQPWKNKVNIDRFDLEPILRRSFKQWWQRVQLTDLIPAAARAQNQDFYPHIYAYDSLFQHPDPLKNATARLTDLKSGSTTLHRIYTEMGKNPKRELTAEAELLGITYEELIQIKLTSLSTMALEVVNNDRDE